MGRVNGMLYLNSAVILLILFVRKTQRVSFYLNAHQLLVLRKP